MRKIRSTRGRMAITTPDMPTKEEWDDAYGKMWGDLNYKYFALFNGKSYDCEQLFMEVDLSLVAAERDRRFWGEKVLLFLGLPVK